MPGLTPLATFERSIAELCAHGVQQISVPDGPLYGGCGLDEMLARTNALTAYARTLGATLYVRNMGPNDSGDAEAVLLSLHDPSSC